jgi:hypothetical protein
MATPGHDDESLMRASSNKLFWPLRSTSGPIKAGPSRAIGRPCLYARRSCGRLLHQVRCSPSESAHRCNASMALTGPAIEKFKHPSPGPVHITAELTSEPTCSRSGYFKWRREVLKKRPGGKSQEYHRVAQNGDGGARDQEGRNLLDESPGRGMEKPSYLEATGQRMKYSPQTPATGAGKKSKSLE